MGKIILFLMVFVGIANASDHSLQVDFQGERAQIEVGGPYVGIRLHGSSPALNRISFFYPVANSIDESTTLWTWDMERIMGLGLQVGNQPRRWIGVEPCHLKVTPYDVCLMREDSLFALRAHYRFCSTKPAFTAEYTLTNVSDRPERFEFYSHLELALRTCHTYRRVDRASMRYDTKLRGVFASFEDEDTGPAEVFVINAGKKPEQKAWTAPKADLANGSGDSWMEAGILSFPPDSTQRPMARFVYSDSLKPGESMRILQIIGSAKKTEAVTMASDLFAHHQRETRAFEKAVMDATFNGRDVTTGDSVLDRAVGWSKAVMAVNRHYLDGDFVPMPCPALYNFYFTHDVLLTDLAAVFFDIDRVKDDLTFIANHTHENGTIPHAYYWKDGRYVTEYAGDDNWNHFWFIQMAAAYLRHSGDRNFVRRLHPLMDVSVSRLLKSLGDDGLMQARRPDWWDIGDNYGPRAYMTLLAARTLREYLFVSCALGLNPERMSELETLSQRMESALRDQLWDAEAGYLMNIYEDGRQDPHLYTGSLLAVHYGLLDDNTSRRLMHTATHRLLDSQLGIYNAVPMDFHLLGDDLKFNGMEMGQPYHYMNGGIWPHGNAWYALGLIRTGQHDAAAGFLKRIMSLDGIINSPNGQPALYEFRIPDPAKYGKIEKTQFLWAGGFYLYTLYHLLGVRENVWNLSFHPWTGEGMDRPEMTVFIHGNPVTVRLKGGGDGIGTIRLDGKSIPWAVIPEEFSGESLEFVSGPPQQPILISAGSAVTSCQYLASEHEMEVLLRAFPGHETCLAIRSPLPVASVRVDGKPAEKPTLIMGQYQYEFTTVHSKDVLRVTVQFQERP